MHSAERMASGGCPGHRPTAIPEGGLIAGSVIALAAFNAESLAAREHMVRTDPGSLCAARVARARSERQPAMASTFDAFRSSMTEAADPHSPVSGELCVPGVGGPRGSHRTRLPPMGLRFWGPPTLLHPMGVQDSVTAIADRSRIG
jgi:hypothetical protein